MYWYWIVCGVLMILMEFGIPGFVICFFGISALIVGGLCFFFAGLPLLWQLLIFGIGGAVLAVASRWIAPGIFRGTVSKSNSDIDADNVAGEYCICRENIVPGVPGKVEFRGTLWRAESAVPVSAGENCVIEKRENLTLTVHPLNGNN